MSRLIGSRYVDTEFWSKNAVLGNTSAGKDDTDCARKPKRMTKCHLPWVWNGSIVIIIFSKRVKFLYYIMVFLHKSAVSTELGTAFSFPGLYKSMNRFFIANKLSLANHSMNLVSIPKSPRV